MTNTPPQPHRPLIVLIAAVGRGGVIGDGQRMPWHLPEDLAHFRRLTLGHPVVMGRRTWDSLPARFRPLPGRRNLVVTRNVAWHADGAQACPSLEAAIATAGDVPRVFIIGGAQLYRAALVRADMLELTEIDADFAGSVHFPTWERAAFDEVARERHHAAAPNDFQFDFATYQRRH